MPASHCESENTRSFLFLPFSKADLWCVIKLGHVALSQVSETWVRGWTTEKWLVATHAGLGNIPPNLLHEGCSSSCSLDCWSSWLRYILQSCSPVSWQSCKPTKFINGPFPCIKVWVSIFIYDAWNHRISNHWCLTSPPTWSTVSWNTAVAFLIGLLIFHFTLLFKFSMFLPECYTYIKRFQASRLILALRENSNS